MLPGAFSDKVTSAVDFTDEVVGQCDVPVVNLHMTHKCWCECLGTVSEPSFL